MEIKFSDKVLIEKDGKPRSHHRLKVYKRILSRVKHINPSCQTVHEFLYQRMILRNETQLGIAPKLDTSQSTIHHFFYELKLNEIKIPKRWEE